MSENALIIQEQDLALSDNNALNGRQMQLLLKHTPKKYVRERPAKGGGKWEYVTGGYVKKCLNLMFGFNWSFNILEQLIVHGEVVVKGRLTIVTNGQTIVKEQFGNKEVICKKGGDTPLSIGNDMKAAATDALKKCAAEIGIAADIYNKEEFREIIVESDTIDEIKSLLQNGEFDKTFDRAEAEKTLSDRDEKNYGRILRKMKAHLITRSHE